MRTVTTTPDTLANAGHGFANPSTATDPSAVALIYVASDWSLVSCHNVVVLAVHPVFDTVLSGRIVCVVPAKGINATAICACLCPKPLVVQLNVVVVPDAV